MAIFFDITGAFNHLRWEDVLEEVQKRKCSAAMHNILRDYLHDRRMTIVENYEKKTKKLAMGLLKAQWLVQIVGTCALMGCSRNWKKVEYGQLHMRTT